MIDTEGVERESLIIHDENDDMDEREDIDQEDEQEEELDTTLITNSATATVIGNSNDPATHSLMNNHA